ncbi:MAG: MFS transporter [bacterium]|nr:MFS transporter [bacterium]
MAWAGYLPVFIINAVSYLFSAGFESFIRLPALERKTTRQTRIVDDVVEGCRYVYRCSSLLIILVMVGVIHFFVGSIEAVIPVLASNLISIPLAMLTCGFLLEYVPPGILPAASGFTLLPISIIAYHRYSTALPGRSRPESAF